MIEWSDFAALSVLAYAVNGSNMVLFHTRVSPLHQPGYVHLGSARRFAAGAVWPVVAKLNDELGWFMVTFLGVLLVMVAEYWLVSKWIESVAVRFVLVWLASVLPIINIPTTLGAMILWMIFAKPFGLRTPPGMDRLRS